MVSENPDTHGFRDMGPQTPSTAAESLEMGQSTVERTRTVKRRVCPDCEVSWRLEAQAWHPVGKLDPDWSLRSKVVLAMKLTEFVFF